MINLSDRWRWAVLAMRVCDPGFQHRALHLHLILDEEVCRLGHRGYGMLDFSVPPSALRLSRFLLHSSTTFISDRWRWAILAVRVCDPGFRHSALHLCLTLDLEVCHLGHRGYGTLDFSVPPFASRLSINFY